MPSYGRPSDLSRCLAALAAQCVSPHQIVIVVRPEDVDTRRVLASASNAADLTVVLTHNPGQVAALNAGLAAVISDITAITDDDAAPTPEWLMKLLDRFTDPSVAAVGGRDAVAGSEDGRHPMVGRVAWCGRITGNHHRGIGPVRPVDILKGSNMAFRTTWLRRFGFDRRLRGDGAQVHNDLMVCLKIRRAGGRVLYDPEVLVDHYPAHRPAGDHRTVATTKALADEVHNETLALMEFLPSFRRLCWLVWALLRGSRRNPGFLVSLALLPTHRFSAIGVLVACWRGRFAGVLTWWIGQTSA